MARKAGILHRTSRCSDRLTISIPFLLVVLISLPLYGALSPKYVDWAKGPARWLMTRAEQKAWQSITTDDEAQAFIDLFWARRDPTPGTYTNEFKLEFEARVKYADETFAHAGSAGSMTDRGHALIVLGYPTNADRFQKKRGAAVSQGTMTRSSGTFGQGTMSGEREVWSWEKKDARKFGLPYIEAVFVEDPANGVVQRDTARNNIMTAYANAVERAIIDHKMTDAPEWARAEPTAQPAAVVGRTKGAVHTRNAPVAVARGVHSLMLVKNAGALADPQGGTDPLAGAKNIDTFGKTDDVGYVFEYCGPSERLMVTISITGANGNMVAPAEEVPIEAIKAVPGCGLVRGSIPLGDLQVAPGTYTFKIKLDDGPQSYNLSEQFRIE